MSSHWAGSVEWEVDPRNRDELTVEEEEDRMRDELNVEEEVERIRDELTVEEEEIRNRDEFTGQDDSTAQDREAGQSATFQKLFDAPFDYMDIVDAIKQLSESSGPGPDGISAILLKKAKISIALMMQNIFHSSIENGDIPDILKVGFICPILKPNCKRDRAASWRPVSLTSHVMKTMERVVRRHIVNH